MKKFLVALVLLGTSLFSNAEIVTLPIPGAPGLSITAGTGVNALPLADIRTNPAATNVTMGDDEVRNIPLGFNFPFWGQTFTNSWMSSNGFVAFQPSLGHGCCSGVDLTNTTHPAYNYTIFGVHSDLYAHPGVGSNWYLRETNAMTYGWYNVSQCCNADGGNSFEIKINSSGGVDTRIAGALVQWNAVTSGMAGDLSRGEYFQAYHGQGINIPMGSGGISWNTTGGFTGSDPCLTNPLSSPSCSGYAAAYLTQQCNISALYDPSCPGYATANFTLQCSLNPLYNEQCSGYADAYLTQQCSLNPLYSNRCSGYQQAYYNQQCDANPMYDVNCPGYASAYLDYQCSLNALYSTTCLGYEQAYFNQQCSLNPLYNRSCPGYETAYFNQQCTASALYNANCPGYAEAYHTQQCNANPLYATTCTGYADAYFSQQCSISGLYSTRCPNYAEAYFSQQCSLNGLYNTRCPNYAEAYATQQALLRVNTTPTTTTTTTTTEVASAAPVTTNDGSSSVAVAVVADPIVNQAVTSTATSASPAAAATATVPLVQTPTATTAAAVVEMKVEAKQEQKTEEKKTDASSSSVSSTQTAQGTSTDTKPAAPTARQELAAKREAAAKAAAVEKGKNLANEMGKVADIESQKQVQNVVIQAMGFTPGFDAYGKVMVPDAIGYKPFTVYNNQKNVDNRRLGMGLYGPSDRLHNELVSSQYGE